MKSKFRMAPLALGLILGGIITAAWGAESVVNLISDGENAIKELKSSKAAYENMATLHKNLLTEEQQITADNQKYNAAAAAFKQRQATVLQEGADFKKRCNDPKHPPTKEVRTQCLKDRPGLVAKYTDVNATAAQLNKQQTDLVARSKKYNSDMADLQANAKKVQQTYTAKLTDDENWLNKVRDFVGAPAVQPYAKKYHCPDVNKVAKNVTQVIEQSDQYLACLKKIAGTN